MTTARVLAGATRAKPPDPALPRPPQPAVDARGYVLGGIGVLVALFALRWAQGFFVPLLLGLLIAFTLSPVVKRLERWHLPRWAAATLVMLALCGLAALAVGALGGQVRSAMEQLPEAAKKMSAQLSSSLRTGTLEKVQSAAREIEKATQAASPPAARAVVAQPPAFHLGSFLWNNSLAVASFVTEALMVLLLAYILLLSGEVFRDKLARLAGPSLSRRKVTLQALDGMDGALRGFLVMLLATNALLALLSWGAFLALGLENAGAWALAAGVLHFIPYLGPAALAAAVGVTAYMQFDSVAMALGVAGASLAIAGVVGVGVATWMTSRQASMNAVAIFVALLFFGWLWGAWGLLLAIPIAVTFKVAAEFIEPLHPVAELLRA